MSRTLPPHPPRSWSVPLFLLGMAVLAVASFVEVGLDWRRLLSMDAASRMGRFLAEMTQPAVEPAFLTALEADPSLVRYGLDNNILLVSPTNLMVALRTIENLWRYERQNQNSRQIAERAGRLYEKLRLFVEEMQQMGGSLHKAQESYDKAMGRLVNGRGNLIAQAERFRELGVEVTKPLPESLVNRALEREESAD